MQVTKAEFSLSSISDQTFAGFHKGDDWNGWTCPYFKYDEAERILRLSEANGYSWEYDETNDAFLVSHEDDPDDYEPELFQAVELTTPTGEILVYGIGAYSWSWLTT